MAEKTAAPRTRRERVEQKERAILDAARTTFIERGYDGAAIVEIARRAGISEGSIYSYYKTKHELMQAVLAEFWDQLTAGAERAVDVGLPTFEQMRALAAYHLDAVIENFDFVNLTFALRRSGSEVAASREQMRRYVAVFDNIARRGMDRGDIRPDSVIWLMRDSFYGTLEYAARTLIGRSRRAGEDFAAVVANLVHEIAAGHGTGSGEIAPPASSSGQNLDQILERLEAVAGRLEAASDSGTSKRR